MLSTLDEFLSLCQFPLVHILTVNLLKYCPLSMVGIFASRDSRLETARDTLRPVLFPVFSLMCNVAVVLFSAGSAPEQVISTHTAVSTTKHFYEDRLEMSSSA